MIKLVFKTLYAYATCPFTFKLKLCIEKPNLSDTIIVRIRFVFWRMDMNSHVPIPVDFVMQEFEFEMHRFHVYPDFLRLNTNRIQRLALCRLALVLNIQSRWITAVNVVVFMSYQ
jgi:hypothetical protein